MIPYFVPPEITCTEVGSEIRRRFTDDSANMNSVLLGKLHQPNEESVRFIQVLPDWRGPSFKTLAKEDPARLLALVAEDRLAEHDLTFAAEALGLIENSSLATELLERLTRHSSALVREGAVYGLAMHPDLARPGPVRAAVEQLVQDDPSPGVREAATEALDP